MKQTEQLAKVTVTNWANTFYFDTYLEAQLVGNKIALYSVPSFICACKFLEPLPTDIDVNTIH